LIWLPVKLEHVMHSLLVSYSGYTLKYCKQLFFLLVCTKDTRHVRCRLRVFRDECNWCQFSTQGL